MGSQLLQSPPYSPPNTPSGTDMGSLFSQTLWTHGESGSDAGRAKKEGKMELRAPLAICFSIQAVHWYEHDDNVQEMITRIRARLDKRGTE